MAKTGKPRGTLRQKLGHAAIMAFFGANVAGALPAAQSLGWRLSPRCIGPPAWVSQAGYGQSGPNLSRYATGPKIEDCRSGTRQCWTHLYGKYVPSAVSRTKSRNQAARRGA